MRSYFDWLPETLAHAFCSTASSCLGSKAHQRALGGQWKGSCSLSYFPVGSERCWREVGPFVHSWVELSCRELDFWRVVVLFSSLSIPCIPGREVGLFRKAVCSFWNFSFKAWAWITYRLDRVRCWREVGPYLHVPGDFPGRDLFSISELVCVEGLCSFWNSCVLNDNHSNLVSFPGRSDFLWVSGLLYHHSIFAVFIWWAYGTCLLEKDRIARFDTLMKWNFRSDMILEIVTLWLVFISGSEERVFWFSSVFDCKSNFFEPHGLSTCTPVQEGRWCLLDLPRLQILWSLQTIFLNSCSKVGGRRWAWLGRNSGFPVCEGFGRCWTWLGLSHVKFWSRPL